MQEISSPRDGSHCSNSTPLHCRIQRSMVGEEIDEKKTATGSGHGVHKEKKIKFANEAGGMLCHVKVFEESPTSFLVPENDKDDKKLHANKN